LQLSRTFICSIPFLPIGTKVPYLRNKSADKVKRTLLHSGTDAGSVAFSERGRHRAYLQNLTTHIDLRIRHTRALPLFLF